MRKTILTILLIAFIACTIALPVAAAMPMGSPHCTTMSEGFYVGLQTGLITLVLLILAAFAWHGIISPSASESRAASCVARLMPSWIPPPVLLAAAATDDPQMYDRGVIGVLRRLLR